jgi:uncharacterized protein
VVKTGDIVKVRVTEVDVARKRIGLTMKLDAPARGPRENSFEPRNNDRGNRSNSPRPQGNFRTQDSAPSAMASAFAKLKR